MVRHGSAKPLCAGSIPAQASRKYCNFYVYSFLNIKFALVLGILAMAFEIVPIVGPVLAAIPAVFFAFLQDPGLGLWVIIFYILVQQLENHLLVPVVLGKTTGLNPVVVIMALLIGNQIAGISGMVLSVPIATVIVEMLEDLAKHKEEAKHNGTTPVVQ